MTDSPAHQGLAHMSPLMNNDDSVLSCLMEDSMGLEGGLGSQSRMTQVGTRVRLRSWERFSVLPSSFVMLNILFRFIRPLSPPKHFFLTFHFSLLPVIHHCHPLLTTCLKVSQLFFSWVVIFLSALPSVIQALFLPGLTRSFLPESRVPIMPHCTKLHCAQHQRFFMKWNLCSAVFFFLSFFSSVWACVAVHSLVQQLINLNSHWILIKVHFKCNH